MRDEVTMLEDAQLLVANAPAFVLRSVLALDTDEPVVAAVFRGTAHGVFEARIGGAPVSLGVLAPGWSAYESRLPVEEYDVLPLIRDGVEIEVLVGNGWWRGGLGFAGLGLNYGSAIGFVGELELTFARGHAQRWSTDKNWTAVTAATAENSLYDGVRIDRAAAGAPLDIKVGEFDRAALIPQRKPPIERQEVLRPLSIVTTGPGRKIIDFGQNLVGWTRLRVDVPSRTEIVVRHAEVLENGELAVRPLRGAQATDTYIASGGEELFEPTLTFHGFRYAEVAGLPDLAATDVEAVVVHSRMRRTGYFECSDTRVNQLVRNSVWGQKGNFLDLPTDCPQRDERLGWTGDVAVYAPTALYQFDCADLLHNWLLDLQAETLEAGYVPFVVPNVLKLAPRDALGAQAAIFGPTAIWGDAAAWVAEALWLAYGDRDRLSEHYPAIVMHLESILARVSETGLWDTGFQFGDWLDPTAPAENPLGAKADPSVIATACLYRTASFAAHAAELLGRREDHLRWSRLSRRTRDAFRRHYVQTDGRILSDAQSVYALAIHFGLLDDEAATLAGARLAELVKDAGFHVETGFAGTPYVTWALAETGHVDAAYQLLLEDSVPSWLYAVKMGATTVWERWDSLLPDGSVNPGEMTSFNHYALGAVVNWLYQCVAGIRPEQPGYARLRLQPQPGSGLEWAHGVLDSPHGRIECGWIRDPQGVVTVNCVVPEGVEADLLLPDGSQEVLQAGTHSRAYAESGPR